MEGAGGTASGTVAVSQMIAAMAVLEATASIEAAKTAATGEAYLRVFIDKGLPSHQSLKQAVLKGWHDNSHRYDKMPREDARIHGKCQYFT